MDASTGLAARDAVSGHVPDGVARRLPGRRDARIWAVAAGAALVVATAVFLRLHAGTAFERRAVDDLGQLLAAAFAGVICAARARILRGRARWSWALIASGLLAWAAGELLWSYFELLSHRQTPFPSLADAGFLLFPVGALAGLLVLPSPAYNGTGRVRVLLDGGMVASALFTLSWATSLGSVYRGGADNTFAFVVSLAYPISDLVLLTTALLVVVHARMRASGLVLVAGMASMAVADSGFSYLTALGRYRTGSFVDIAWFAAFLLMAAAAAFYRPSEREHGDRVEAMPLLVLPYLLAVAAVVCAVVQLIREGTDRVELVVAGFALASLLARQFLMTLDNRRLTTRLLARQHELHHRAFHDALTGLPNRALFFERLSHALQVRRRTARHLSILFCDLDDFKTINDSLGHGVGDAVLEIVAARLATAVRAEDTVARLGGDEFAVLLEDEHETEVVVERLHATVAVPLEAGGQLVPVRMSIGRTTVDTGDDSVTVEHVMRQADLAMYRAKRGRRAAGHRAATASADESAPRLRAALFDDVVAGRMGTAVQPIVRPDLTLWALESLARWSHGGVEVAPAQFLDLAEQDGFLGEIDLAVARSALAAARTRDAAALTSVNVGLQRFVDADIAARLDGLLREHGMPADRLIVEITARDVLTSTSTCRAIGQLRELGVRIAVDDFGGNTLERIALVRPDVVKLGRSLVAPLDDPGHDPALIAATVELAHDLGAAVVGSGVETRRQFDVLASLHCDALQGYWISRPVPREDAATQGTVAAWPAESFEDDALAV